MKFLIILLALALLAYLIVRPLLRYTKKPKDTSAPNIEDMQACATCGTYISVKEAILSNGKYYCSKSCLQNAKG